MAVTQGDVARRAGVSPRTVSNVVNKFPLVSGEVRQRVQQAIEELGYQPNVVARNLRRGRSGMLGLAVPELSLPYFSELAELVIAEARRRSYGLVIEQTDGDPARERELVKQNERGHLFDGLILSPLGLTLAQIHQNAGSIPVVLLGEHIAGSPQDHVGINNVAAARDATTHLIQLGHRRIAAIGHQGTPSGETGQLRSAGYRQALRAAGLTVRNSLVVPTASFHRSSGACRHRQTPCSATTTCSPSGRCAPSSPAACGSRRTSRSSASTTSRTRSTRSRHSPRSPRTRKASRGSQWRNCSTG
jgi:LacI family repressor for deo operon, udp, cdd, tsx, nupC, and nupG